MPNSSIDQYGLIESTRNLDLNDQHSMSHLSQKNEHFTNLKN